MPRPRLHDLDQALDVAERLVAEGGPGALTVRALSAATGVPNGAIYHGFGSLAALRGRLWLRAAVDFLDLQAQLITQALDAGSPPDSAVNAVIAAADAPAAFADQRPAAARMLMTVDRNQLLGPELPDQLADSLLDLDRRLVSEVLCRLAVALWGRRDDETVEVMTTCVVDLPTALLRRAFHQPGPDGSVRISADRRARLAAAVRAVLHDAPPTRQPPRPAGSCT
ncbi:TetR/AcrR family transcriptional regulator [Saccharopolyspora rhizosphaerae]|uniref:TetR/AcrR family transcriptional regulator n=1 Tax=Saccharopolyspora rhizosphaerae TaxID=2492662 RepID=A0A3R8R618_9PSEU|nr:TetR/AcrR family transcriptional regulator [Saccharopolyspora rhizosphaerae]RRO19226.1 TetR/AcrR family transcriptional regulator [Saccharopolyspora rhizosphaerae]